jgi:hypothetical protein
MPGQNRISQNWGTIHPSVFSEAAGPLQCTPATPRLHGALRYRCPVTGSFVLVSDETTLANLARPRGRVRCVDCGEMHLLTQDGEEAVVGDPAVIVTHPATP